MAKRKTIKTNALIKSLSAKASEQIAKEQKKAWDKAKKAQTKVTKSKTTSTPQRGRVFYGEKLRQQIRNVNRRLERYDKRGDLYSPAAAKLRSAIKSAGFGFDYIKLPKNPTIAQVLLIRRIVDKFLNDKTSTIKGATAYTEETYERGERLYKALGFDSYGDYKNNERFSEGGKYNANWRKQVYATLGQVNWKALLKDYIYEEVIEAAIICEERGLPLTYENIRNILQVLSGEKSDEEQDGEFD